MICVKCLIDKDENEFAFKSKPKGLMHKACITCVSKKVKEYYYKNRDAAIEYSTKTSKENRIKKQQYVWDYLKNNPCVDCDENDPVVLEFDHKDATEKLQDVSRAVSFGWSIKNIQKEIDKCDVRCANCHKKRTAKQFGWHKYINK